jgi:hypothetical protein
MGARSSRLRTVLTSLVAVVLVVALAGVIAWGIAHLGFLSTGHREPFVTWTLIAWGVFVISVVALRFVPDRTATVIVLAGAVLVGVAAMSGPPNTSTDSARYAWDGIVQLHGVSPYAHVPASHALADLRPSWLFPAASDAGGTAHCTGTRIMTTHETTTHDLLCTAINRPKVPTIYPPMAELWFALVRALVPVTATYWPMQLAGLVVSLGVTVGLLLVLRRTGRSPWWAALWAWCPLVASEAVTNSHVDVLGAALATAGAVLVAFGAGRRGAGRRRPGFAGVVLGGVALGAATATKLIPAIVYPPLLGRWRNWVSIVVGIVVFGLLYVPYIVSTGVKVLGYLPGYLKEEGYDSGTRYALVSVLVKGDGATLVVGVVVVLAAVVSWRLADPARPWSAEVLMIGVTFLAVTPRYPWYALLLIPFVVLSGRWEWLTVALAITLRQLHPSVHTYRWSLVAAIVVILVVTLVRTRRDDWRRWGRRLIGTRRSEAPRRMVG